MNKETVASPIASALKYLVAAFVTFLVGKGFLTTEMAKAMDGEVLAAIGAVSMLLATLGIGIFQNFLAKRNRGGGTSGSGGNSMLPLLLCMATVCSMALGLSSCKTLSDTLKEYPFTGSFYYRDPETGAKAGMDFTPGEAPKGKVKIPRYDEAGNLIGWIDLEGPLSREVKGNAEK